MIGVAVKTPLEIRLGIGIYKTSLLNRPDDYIGFTPSCHPTFYNEIAPMGSSRSSSRAGVSKSIEGNANL